MIEAEVRGEARSITLGLDAGTLREKYQAVRQYTVQICQPLATEDYVVQPSEEVSPAKWHLAHSTWFFEEFMLVKHQPGYKRFHNDFSLIFNSYYQSAGNRLPRFQRGNLSRPTVQEIYDYREYVDQHMVALVDRLPADLYPLLELGLHHEQQHQELLLTDIKYLLGHNPLFPPYKTNFAETLYLEHDHGFVSIPEGEYTIGYSGYGFSFDNEHDIHRVLLKPFNIRKSLVTNAEYMQFITAGGYTNWQHWLDDGWKWVNANEVKAPLYWHLMDGLWFRYGLAGLEAVDPEEPVTHVSFYEASAFAEWAGMRLPTEFEWEAAADHFQWGQRWEHTNSAYLPYPGYKKPEGAVGEYNGKFMVNTMVLRGASVVTSPNHARKTYRNFFSPASRWQFNGIRLCQK